MTASKRPGTDVPGVSVVPHPSGGRNQWSVTVWAGYRDDGKPNRAHRAFRGTRRQAIEFGVECKRLLLSAPHDPAHHTVGSWFEGAFLPHKRALAAREDRSDTTVDALAGNYRRYIAAYPIARLPLTKFDAVEGPAHLVRWFNALSSAPGRRVDRLSGKTLFHALSTMRSGLRYAVQAGPLDKDPFRKFPAELWPKLHHGRPSKRSVGSAGVRAVQEAFLGHELEAEVALATLGLRRGEILGLRIRGSDEDPRNGDVVLDGPEPKVRVRQVVIEVDGGPARVRPFPKSDASVRDLRIPNWMIPVLRAAKRRALELQVAAGDRFANHDLLFPSKGRHLDASGHSAGRGVPGRPRHPGVFDRKFRARLREVGLDGFEMEQVERVSPHALRHSFVPVLINEAGMRAEDVQRLAGHADLKTTQGYRAHDEEPATRAAAALEVLFGQGAGD